MHLLIVVKTDIKNNVKLKERDLNDLKNNFKKLISRKNCINQMACEEI